MDVLYFIKMSYIDKSLHYTTNSLISQYLHLCALVVGVTWVKFLTHCRTLGLSSLQDSITALRASRLGVSWDLKMALQASWHSVVFAFSQHSSPIWNKVSKTVNETVWNKIWPRRSNWVLHICQTKTSVYISHLLQLSYRRPRWLACLPLDPRSRVQTRPRTMDFKGGKIRSTPSFRGEVKPSVPCSRFTACKRILNTTGARRQNSAMFLTRVSPASLLDGRRIRIE
jgi:hypothetical protein